jgi:hypothetical protein
MILKFTGFLLARILRAGQGGLLALRPPSKGVECYA